MVQMFKVQLLNFLTLRHCEAKAEAILNKMSPLRGSGSIRLWPLQKYHPFGVQGSNVYVLWYMLCFNGWRSNPEGVALL
jgi:hypothetical protein